MGGVGVSEACHFLFCAPLSCASIDADHIIAMRAFHGQRDLPTMALIAERAQREGLVCNLTMEDELIFTEKQTRTVSIYHD